MRSAILSKEMQTPTTIEELESESLPDKHERWLRILNAANLTPFYLGDTVEVSERWESTDTNPSEGKRGMIIGLEAGVQFGVSRDYLGYRVRTESGELFRAYHYTLDLVEQAPGNSLLEKLLTETNSDFYSA